MPLGITHTAVRSDGFTLESLRKFGKPLQTDKNAPPSPTITDVKEELLCLAESSRLPKIPRRRRPPKRGYDRGNSQAAAIILSDRERYAGILVSWAELYLERNGAAVREAIREFHSGMLR